MPINLDVVEFFLRLSVALHLRADDDDLVASIAQGARFLPYTAVERHRQVFHNDADAGFILAVGVPHFTGAAG